MHFTENLLIKYVSTSFCHMGIGQHKHKYRYEHYITFYSQVISQNSQHSKVTQMDRDIQTVAKVPQDACKGMPFFHLQIYGKEFPHLKIPKDAWE